MKNIKVILLAVAMLSGCAAYKPMNVSLHPAVSVPRSSQGNGESVVVNVMDERDSASLGNRVVSDAAGEITTRSNIESVVSSRVKQSLEDMGFSVLDKNDNPSVNLKVRVRFLEYSISGGVWSSITQTQATLKAIASRNSSEKKFANVYRFNDKDNFATPPSAEKVSVLLNEALGTVIEKLVTDKELIVFIAN